MKNQMQFESAIARARSIGWVAAVWLWTVAAFGAADFTTTTPGGQFNFNISGTNSPTTITLVRGRLYEFAVNTSSFHPFQLMSNATPLTTSQGVTNNGIFSGSIFFRVPTNAVNYNFRCGQHITTTSLQGTILTVEPPVPPTPPVPQIVSYSFGPILILRSAPATNTFTVIPEFKTNLNFTNWVALTVLSNRFSNGTNETFCGRPAGPSVFIRVRVQ